MSVTRCHYCGRTTIPHAEVERLIGAIPGLHTGHAYVVERSRIYALMRVVDHRTPRSTGGTNTPNNRVIACNDCNCRKGKRQYLDFMFECWHAETVA